MALVGRSARTSLAAGPLPDAVLRAAADQPRVVGTGEHDLFLPPERLAGRTGRLLGTQVVPLPSGHLLNDAAWSYVGDAVARL